MLGDEYAEWAGALAASTVRRYDREALEEDETMRRGQLVRILHLGPWNGTDVLPEAVVNRTVGMIGVIDRRHTDGRWEILVPPFGKYVYQCKEIEPIKGGK